MEGVENDCLRQTDCGVSKMRDVDTGVKEESGPWYPGLGSLIRRRWTGKQGGGVDQVR